MSPGEKKIADCILADPEFIVNATVVSVASKAGVSEGSVVNFAASLGLKGFSQLKIQLAQGLAAYHAQSEFEQVDQPRQVMRKLIDRANVSFESTFEAMGEEMEAIAKLLLQADKICVIGFANSQFVASDLAFRLMRLGLPVQAFSDPLIAGVACAQMTDQSVMIAVSHSGRTRDILACAGYAKEVGAHLVCLTSNGYSPLARECEMAMVAVSLEAQTHQESTTARLTQLMLGDCLVQNVMLRMGEKAAAQLEKMVEVYEENREEM